MQTAPHGPSAPRHGDHDWTRFLELKNRAHRDLREQRELDALRARLMRPVGRPVRSTPPLT